MPPAAKLASCVVICIAAGCHLTVVERNIGAFLYMFCDELVCRVAGVPLDFEGYHGQAERHTESSSRSRRARKCITSWRRPRGREEVCLLQLISLT